MRVGIIGGGAAGLAAAWDLVKAGHEAVVFERAPWLGGQVSTFTVGGTEVERFYHHLFRGDNYFVDLIGELGLGKDLLWVPSTVGFFWDGQVYNFVTPFDLLRFKPVGLVDRIRLGLTSLYLRYESDWSKFEKVTARDWLMRWAGRRNYETVWGPLLRGKFGDLAEEVGMAWLWGKIHLRFASRDRGMQKEVLGYLRGSFGRVYRALGDAIVARGGRIFTRAQVEHVVTAGGEARGIRLASGSAAEWGIGEVTIPTGWEFDAVLATVPGWVFLRLVPDLPESYAALIRNIRYQAAVCLVLVLRERLSPVYWLNIADRSVPFVGVIEQTNLLPPEEYGGRHIVYISNYLARDHPLLKLSGPELFEVYLPHLRRINPRFDPAWVEELHHHREDAAQPVITTNYRARIPSVRTPVRRLYLANTTQVYPEDRGQNYSVRLGYEASRLIQQDLG
jgi:protoporphyrinogen oxidase